MSLRTVIRDEQWARIKDLLPGRSGSCGRTARDNRLFIEAVLYNYRTGILWRDLPEQYGDFRVIHTRMSRWAKAGVWAQVLADFEWALIDSTIVRAHQHSAKGEPEAIGHSRGGLSTKIHVIVDGLGKPTDLHVSERQVSALERADVLLADEAEVVIADKGL